MKLLFSLTLFVLMAVTSFAQTTSAKSPIFEDMYGVFVSHKLPETKRFYVSTFDMDVAFESTIFLILTTKGEKSRTVAFMPENHPFMKPRLKAYNGTGAYLTIQVADVTSLYHDLISKHVLMAYPLKKEDWGQIRFALLDPNGIWVDVVQTIDPKPGYYDAYAPK